MRGNFKPSWSEGRKKERKKGGKKDNVVVMKLCCSDLLSREPASKKVGWLTDSNCYTFGSACNVLTEAKPSLLFPATD